MKILYSHILDYMEIVKTRRESKAMCKKRMKEGLVNVIFLL
jgi:hypothetical protein